MAVSIVTAALAQNTVIQALFDSLIERLVNRVSNEIPMVIEQSIKKYAMDNMNNRNKQHQGLLLEDLSTKQISQKDEKSTKVSEDARFCNSVLKLVDERLKTLEILQMSDMNVSLSHLSDGTLSIPLLTRATTNFMNIHT